MKNKTIDLMYIKEILKIFLARENKNVCLEDFSLFLKENKEKLNLHIKWLLEKEWIKNHTVDCFEGPKLTGHWYLTNYGNFFFLRLKNLKK